MNKKTIYLKDENYNWKQFEYESIEDLKSEFDSRNISIGDGASIGNRASIGDGASIGNRASIGYGASIGNRASIGYGASIGDDASIGDGASIGYDASIGDGASIGDDASIGNRASIGYEVKLLTGLFINGSKHSVTYSGNGMLSIGCHTHSIDEWIANADNIGIAEKYSMEQINEYKAYIQIAKIFHDNLKK